MDITINNGVINVRTERNNVSANLELTPEIKSMILSIYQAGRDKEMINFITNVESTTVLTQED